MAEKAVIEMADRLVISGKCKALGQLGLFVDLWYPWISLYAGAIPWDSYGDGGFFSWVFSGFYFGAAADKWMISLWNISLVIAGIIWSTSAAIALVKSFLSDTNVSQNDISHNAEYWVLSTHLTIAITGSILQFLWNLSTGHLGFLIFTIVSRFLILGFVMIYFREVKMLRGEVDKIREAVILPLILLSCFLKSDDEEEDEEEEMVSSPKKKKGNK